MNPLQALSRPLAFLEQCAGLAALGGLWYWWLQLTESTTGRLLVSVLTLLLLVAGVWGLVRRGRTRFAGSSPGASPAQAVGAVVVLALSLVAAYWLIWWVPTLDGLNAQLVSAGLRFLTAFLLVALCWSNLLAALASGPVAAEPLSAARQ